MSTKSSRAGLQLAVSSFQTYMRNNMLSRDSSNIKCLSVSGAPVYCAGVIEYMLAEIVEVGGNQTRSRKSNEISVEDLSKGIFNDEELNGLFFTSVIGFDKSLYSRNLESNIIDASNFTLNENSLHEAINVIIKSAYINVTPELIKILIDYVQELHSKMISNNDNPIDLIRRGLSGLLPLPIDDIFMDAVRNEYAVNEYDTKINEALIMDFTIKFALKFILIKAYDIYSKEGFIAKFSERIDRKQDDTAGDTEYLNISEDQLFSCIASLTMFKSTVIAPRQIDDSILLRAMQNLRINTSRHLNGKIADIIAMEFNCAIGKCEILPDLDTVKAEELTPEFQANVAAEREKKREFLAKIKADNSKRVLYAQGRHRVVLRDNDLDHFDRLTREKGQDFKSRLSFAADVVRVIKLAIDSMLRMVIDNARLIASNEVKECISADHIKQSSKLLSMPDCCESKRTSIEGLLQENEFTSDLSHDAKKYLINLAHSSLYRIISDAITYTEHRRAFRVSMPDVISALTLSSPTSRIFEYALRKQTTRITTAVGEVPTVLMTLASNGFLKFYYDIIKNARSNIRSIAVDTLDASTSEKKAILSLFDGSRSLVDRSTIRRDDTEGPSQRFLPVDPKKFLEMETLRRTQFCLPTCELPAELTKDIFFELYSVFENPSLFEYQALEDRVVENFLCQYRRAESMTRPCIVGKSLFEENWHSLTLGIFDSVNLSNCFFAGGSVLCCLTEIRDDIASSKSDIDIFLHGLSEEDANKKVLDVILHVVENRKKIATTLGEPQPVSVVARSSHAITLLGTGKFRPIQFVLRAYRSPSEVLLGFDVDSCCVGFDGTSCFASPRAWRALVTRVNAIDLSRRSPSYEARLCKYALRGFAIYVGQQFRRSEIDEVKLKLGVISGLGDKGLVKLLANDLIESTLGESEKFQETKNLNSNYVIDKSESKEATMDPSLWELADAYGGEVGKKFQCFSIVDIIDNDDSDDDNNNNSDNEVNGQKINIEDSSKGTKYQIMVEKFSSRHELEKILTGMAFLVNNPGKQGLLTSSFEPTSVSEDFYQDALWKNGEDHFQGPLFQSFYNSLRVRLVFGDEEFDETSVDDAYYHSVDVINDMMDDGFHPSRSESEIEKFVRLPKSDAIIACCGLSFSKSSDLLCSIGSQLVKVLKQVHPSLTLKKDALTFLQMHLAGILSKIQDQSYVLKNRLNKKMISSRDVQTSVRLTYRNELAKHAVSEGTKAVTKYFSNCW